ncbi:MAG: hypothetical protein C4516_00055 [Oxalobacter sp.]|nr:MAG: hypothetical protein C4516_00055 [Oxalobacter sp.]
MKKLNLKFLVIAVGLTFTAGAMAQGMSKEGYMSGMAKIKSDYSANKTACSSQSGNQKDICLVEAKGMRNVAKAELEFSYKPTAKKQYNVKVAKAEAQYSVANERCDDLGGNAKDVCVKEAKAVRASSKADAKVQLKVSEANKKARNRKADARNEAVSDKVDANFAVAKEKCDKFTGSAKDDCLMEAKTRYSK